MRKQLLLLSFIEGAAVMAAELCGAKMLAPIFGSSLYVWASVMAITLAALAGGYFFGGFLTAKNKNYTKRLYHILLAASLLLVLMPVISHYLVPRISYLPFLAGVIISTICLLFFPVFFLGASSPLFIVIQTPDKNEAGKTSGSVYAVSTLGGIVATFLCGFYMIPVLGLNITTLSFGILLFAVTILVFKIFTSWQALLLVCFVYLNVQFTNSKTNKLMESDSILGHIEVEDVVSNGHAVRLLKINSIIQTEMELTSKKSVSEYVRLLDTLIPRSTQQQALVLGSGGGLTANLLLEKNYAVTAVEFDGRIIEASEKYFSLSPKINSVCDDARHYLNHCEKQFDIVLIDIFKAEEQPSHVVTMESLEKIKSITSDSACLFINWHGYTKDELGKGTAVLYNTLKQSGFSVTLTSFSADESHRNIVFVAGKKIHSKKMPYEINDPLPETKAVNTDSRPVLEAYNAHANKLWRSNYLRYYQGR